MADITVVAANVKAGAGAIEKSGIAGETITAGDAVHLAADGQIEAAENDLTSVEAAAVGIAINDAAALQPVKYVVSGVIDMGAIMTIGAVYIVGAAPGGIAPEGDAVTGEFVTILGVATTTSLLKLGIIQSGVAHA